jgi:hypothetical protein
MIVSPILDIGSAPGIGVIFGSTGNQAVIERINSEWAGGGVVFGQASDPFARRFDNFKNVVTNVIADTTNKIRNTYDFIMGADKVREINEDDHLNAVPACMQVPILMYAPIRAKLAEGIIDGWGIDADMLPSEDVVGRLIANGQVEQTYNFETEKLETPEFFEYEWKSTDPDFEIEELEQLDESRRYIDSFITEQLGPDGDRLDPTAFASGGTIGDLR